MSDPNPYEAVDVNAPGGESSKDDRLFAMLAHISAIFTGFIGPLVIWLIKKDESEFISDQAKEALNFQITLIIAIVICFVLMFVLIGFFLVFAVALAAVVLPLIGGIKANGGERYRYPFTLRLIQ